MIGPGRRLAAGVAQLAAHAAVLGLAAGLSAAPQGSAYAQTPSDRSAVLETCLVAVGNLPFCECVVRSATQALDDEATPHFAGYLRASQSGGGEQYLLSLDNDYDTQTAERIRRRIVDAVLTVQDDCGGEE